MALLDPGRPTLFLDITGTSMCIMDADPEEDDCGKIQNARIVGPNVVIVRPSALELLNYGRSRNYQVIGLTYGDPSSLSSLCHSVGLHFDVVLGTLASPPFAVSGEKWVVIDDNDLADDLDTNFLAKKLKAIGVFWNKKPDAAVIKEHYIRCVRYSVSGKDGAVLDRGPLDELIPRIDAILGGD